jgi:hypothetical protein
MLIQTRNKITLVSAAIGGLAALGGTVNTSSGPSFVIDVAIGAGLWYALSYVVCTLIIKYKK